MEIFPRYIDLYHGKTFHLLTLFCFILERIPMSKIFYGNWHINEMELWDQDFIDAEVPGSIHFSNDGMGSFQFGYVHGFIDCRYSKKNGEESVAF
jgi:hypothetical protein